MKQQWRNIRSFSLRPTFWSFSNSFVCSSILEQPIFFLSFSMVTFTQVHRSKRLKINFQIELHKEVFTLIEMTREVCVYGFKRNLIVITTAEKILLGVVMRNNSASFFFMLLDPYFVSCFNDFSCFHFLYNSLPLPCPPPNDVNNDITRELRTPPRKKSLQS